MKGEYSHYTRHRDIARQCATREQGIPFAGSSSHRQMNLAGCGDSSTQDMMPRWNGKKGKEFTMDIANTRAASVGSEREKL